MTIGCLLDCVSRNAGGLFESVRRLAQSLPVAGDSMRVFSLEDENTPADLPAWQPLAVRTFPSRLGSWGFAPELFPALCDANLDVLLTHGLWKYSSVASLQWSRRTGRPVIIHPHGMLDPWAVRNSAWKKRVAGLFYENANLRRAACLRALCASEAQAMRAFGLRNPICVIPNGMDLPLPVDGGQWPVGGATVAGGRSDGKSEDVFNAEELTTGALTHRPPTTGHRRTLLYLGRLHPKKNLGPLLRAWADVQRDHAAARDWVLAIAGWDQGGYEEELKVECSRLQVPWSDVTASPASSDFSVSAFQRFSVLFCGPQFNDAKAACYANCDAFILPSLSEGLPMVVLEAWAYAKPVLMTSECNLPEGFAAPAALRVGTDAPGIAAGLRALLDMTDAERATMGTRGRELVATKFSWPSIGDEMRRVCEWTLGGGEPPASVRCKS